MPERGAPDELEQLREVLAHVQRMVASRPTIDHAIGILIATEGVSPEEGFERLRNLSQHLNMPVREIARRLVSRHLQGALMERSRTARENSGYIIKESRRVVADHRSEPANRRRPPRKPDVDGNGSNSD